MNIKNAMAVGTAFMASISFAADLVALPDLGVALDPDEGLMWQDNAEVAELKLTLADATRYCQRLTIGTHRGWRLPTLSELSAPFERRPKLCEKRGMLRHGAKALYQAGELSHDGHVELLSFSDCGHVWGKPTEPHHLRCTKTITPEHAQTLISEAVVFELDGEVVLGVPPNHRPGPTDKLPLVELAKQFAAARYQRMQAPAAPATLPQKPAYATPAALTKGEFENGQMFAQRQQQEDERVRKLNEGIDRDFAALSANWDQRLAQLQAEHAKKLIAFKVARSNVLRGATSMALGVKHGAPRVTSSVYDADTEQFNVQLTFEQSGLKHDLTVPVPLKYAPQFKEIVSARGFRPVAVFEMAGQDARPKRVANFQDPALLVDKYLFDNAQHSVADLQKFIETSPDARVLKQAEVRLKELRAKDAQEEKQRIENERVAAARRLQEARLYNAEKSVGQKVCADVTTRGLFSSDTYTISAFVEGKSGSRIQLRIADPRGITSYNGAQISRGTILWDTHSSWKGC